MYIDWKYVLKRVIICVLIALILMTFRRCFLLQVHAETISNNIPLTYISLSSSGYGSNSGSTLPRYQSYGNYLSTTFYNNGNYIMTPGNSYYVYYVVEMVALDLSLPNSIQFFVQTSGGNVIQATPDREEYFYLYHTGDNTYTVVYMFGIDSTVNVTTWSFQYNYSSSYNANFTQSGVTNATLTVVLPDNNSGGGGSGSGSSTIIDLQPVIINQIQNTQTLINNQNQNTQDIIDNQNDNTQDIIDNQNQNTQDIIDNQNANTDKEIDSQKVCNFYSSSDIKDNNKYLNSDGSLSSNNNYGVSDYLNIDNSEVYIVTRFNNSSRYYCFYSQDKTLISCSASNTQTNDSLLTVPDNSYFVRFTFYKSSNVPRFKICKNGNQAIQDSLTDDSINSDTGNDFFDNFNYGDDSLSSVITAPLRFFNRMTSTCQPIRLTWLSTNIDIPCGDTIFWNRQDVSGFRDFWNILFGGVALYFLGTKLYKVVHDAIDPQKDNIESVGV